MVTLDYKPNDYQTIQGIRLPFKYKQTASGQTISITVTDIQLNPTLNSKDFE